MKRFTFWFAMQFLSYALIVANGRAYTHALYTATILTDALIALQGFTISRKFVRDADSMDWVAGAGYVAGGVCGSVASIWATVHIYGQ